eukprot:TRINITY_DN12843_c0_g2_i1.p1 TRINITY_DN12843_c0_g2~~TRINITY_DN12843_c0_g2_i1.p1  ORF type:complete len:215 (+),score=35.57 TRINITY_DN12843_c0_g2_i1:72-716(+)
MEDFAIQDDKMYAASLRVRNTFIELVAYSPELKRCSSEPSSASSLRKGGAFAANVSAALLDADPVAVENASWHVSPSSVAAVDSITEDSCSTDFDAKKRVIVRDLPCKVGCHRMKSELSALGLDGSYDTIEFPSQWNKRRGKLSFMGYGFIDFTSEEAAVSFISTFSNHRFDDFQSEKAARVEFATAKSTLEGHAKRSQRLVFGNCSSSSASSS